MVISSSVKLAWVINTCQCCRGLVLSSRTRRLKGSSVIDVVVNEVATCGGQLVQNFCHTSLDKLRAPAGLDYCTTTTSMLQ